MELVCYTYPGWKPRIRPAPQRRLWMDRTPESFAYRCLPLAIANAHGWEILSPCGFAARWLGGGLTEDVKIRVDPGTEPRVAPVSLFGQGTVTFHIDGIFRTPPGWNLMVGGSPNEAKDGIAPLTGVIETDWSPYTFTMNWRFTRPDHWVRFEENEPIAFIFPVERGLVESVEPRILPIEDEEGLRARFEAWSASRNAFQQRIQADPPARPADKWQKLYYRGVAPDGGPGPADHQSKLRVKPFAFPDGSRLAPAGAEPRPDPAQPPATEGEQALRRRDRLLDALERQRRLLPDAREVPRRGPLSAEAFLEHFYAPARPVILTGLIEDWPARTRWTEETLRAGKLAEGDMRPLPAFLASLSGEIRAEPAGTFSQLAQAQANRLVAQLRGRRRIALLPPSESGRLEGPAGAMSDVMDPDQIDRFPSAADARIHEIDLEEGELLFLPLGWWHQSTALNFSAGAWFADFRWPNDGAARPDA